MRVLVSTDIHANILAAEKAVELAQRLGVDQHIHLGDALDLGPWPEETIQFLTAHGTKLLMGNHEEYHCSKGFGPVILNRMEVEERSHYCWTSAQLSEESKGLIENLPYAAWHQNRQWTFHFQHYAMDGIRISEKKIDLDKDSLAGAFDAGKKDVHFFGHVHRCVDIGCGPRFLCLGASGCNHKSGESRMVFCLDIAKDSYSVNQHLLDWDVEKVRRAIKQTLTDNRDWLLENMFPL